VVQVLAKYFSKMSFTCNGFVVVVVVILETVLKTMLVLELFFQIAA
jgi:hypothetical protein